MNSLLIAWLFGMAGLGGAEPAQKPAPTQFPIVAWNKAALTDSELNALRNAQFNMVHAPAADADAARRANTAGFRVMLLQPEQPQGTPSEWVSYAKTFENVAGWTLADAVADAQTTEVAKWIAGLRAAAPQRWAMASLPRSAAGNWGTTLGELLRAGLPAIAVQRSDWRSDGTDDNTGFLVDVEAIRQISSKVGVPIWGMVHVAREGPHRWASSSDLRFQSYSYLAAGAKGLCYRTQWPTLRDLAGAAPDEGELTADEGQLGRRISYELDSIGEINREVLVLAPALLSLTSTGLFFVGDGVSGFPTLEGSGQAVASVTAEAALVGMFTDGQRTAWAMIVNARHAKQKSAQGLKSTLRVAVNPRVTRVTEIDRITAYPKEVPLDFGTFFVTIPGGTGCLFHLETSEGAKKP